MGMRSRQESTQKILKSMVPNTNIDYHYNSNFMPDTGTLEYLRLPAESENVRIESGVREKDEISVYYDPMIAKVVVRGKDRAEAIKLLDRTLKQFLVVGVRTNIPLLRKIIQQDQFKDGTMDTGFISDNRSILFGQDASSMEAIAIGCVLQILLCQSENCSLGPWILQDGASNFIPRRIPLSIQADQPYDCEVILRPGMKFKVNIVRRTWDSCNLILDLFIESNQYGPYTEHEYCW